MFQVWMKNCLVSRAYCFRKLYVYIEDWIKFAFVQTVFCFSHFIFVPCLPVLAIIRSSISSGQKIEHWTSSDQRHFCATFFLTWPVWKTASQIISSCLTAKNQFSEFKLKYQIFFIYLPRTKKEYFEQVWRYSFITDRFWHQSCESHDTNIRVLRQLNINKTDYYPGGTMIYYLPERHILWSLRKEGGLKCCCMETNSQIKIRNDTFFFRNKRLSTRSNARQYTSLLEFLQALNTTTKSRTIRACGFLYSPMDRNTSFWG